MALEVEVKYPGVDLAALKKRLLALGAEYLGITLERNVVFDTPDRALLKARCLLRLRECDGLGSAGSHSTDALLTFKRPAPGDGQGGYKRQEEFETHLTNGATMRTILAGLGYSPAFAYDKVRELCLLDGVLVCLDQLPFGDEGAALYEVAELEGDEAAIAALAQKLDLPPELASAENYHDLHRRWRAGHGLAPREDFAFSEEAAARIRHEIVNRLAGAGNSSYQD